MTGGNTQQFSPTYIGDSPPEPRIEDKTKN